MATGHPFTSELGQYCTGNDETSFRKEQWAQRRTVDEISVAILPLGAIEQHGPHLPLGTDLFLAEAFANAVAKECDDHSVAVLPASAFGASFEHARAPGTIAIPDAALQELWGAIIHSVTRAGVRRVILLNAHGGQTPNAQIVIRKARFESAPPVLAVLINLQTIIHDCLRANSTIADLSEEQTAWEYANGIHGGLVETALMLHLHPGLVDTSEAKHFKPFPTSRKGSLEPHGGSVSYGWRVGDVFPDGVGGFASSATPGLGQAIFRQALAEVLNIVRDTRDSAPSEVLRSP